MASYDVGVIGGGLSGTAAAIELARAGKSVILFEKSSRSHDKVCGEFLSPECSDKLKSLGIDLFKLGAPTVSNFRLHFKEKSIERALPKVANAYSRRVLDQMLLQICEDEGVTIFENEMVTELRENGEGLQITTATSRRVEVKAVVVATGKFDFKSIGARHSKDSKWIGYKTHLQLSPVAISRLQNSIELFVFDSGYGGLILVENDQANLAFIVRAEAAKSIGMDWIKVRTYLMNECTQLCEYLKTAEPLLPRLLTISPVPYGYIRDSAAAANIFCTGDQLAVIPSLTGDGMAIALMTGQAAAKSIIEEGYYSASSFHAQAVKQLRPQIQNAFRLHQLFNSSKLFGLAMKLIKLWPSVIDRAFSLTRLRA